MSYIIKKCICVKDFSTTDCDRLFKIFKHNKLLFKKNHIYEYYIESSHDTVWVIYDNFGDDFTSGLRFHINKEKDKIDSVFSFYSYFKNERSSKMTIINRRNETN